MIKKQSARYCFIQRDTTVSSGAAVRFCRRWIREEMISVSDDRERKRVSIVQDRKNVWITFKNPPENDKMTPVRKKCNDLR